jgi:hypothetical protein
MNLNEAVSRACEEPSLLKALTWICVWDADRAVKQAIGNTQAGTRGPGGELWDTCFEICLKAVFDVFSNRKPLSSKINLNNGVISVEERDSSAVHYQPDEITFQMGSVRYPFEEIHRRLKALEGIERVLEVNDGR